MRQAKALTRHEIKEKICDLILSENPEDWRLAHTLQYFLNVTILDPSDTPHFVIEDHEEEPQKEMNWLNPNDIKPAPVPEAIAPEGMNLHGSIVHIIN